MTEKLIPTGPAEVTRNQDGQVVISIPINLKRRGGRKVIVAPPNTPQTPVPRSPADNPFIQALLRAHRWQRMLDGGKFRFLSDIAAREKLDTSYVSRIFNLTVLAPEIVEAILDDTLPEHITLFDLAVDPPRLWSEQRAKVGI
jgi:hypothetical protein